MFLLQSWEDGHWILWNAGVLQECEQCFRRLFLEHASVRREQCSISEHNYFSDSTGEMDTNGSNGKKRSKEITCQELCKHFNLKLEDACKKIGLSSTSMKKLCRKYGVSRWPYRKYRGLISRKEKLEEEAQKKNASAYAKLRIQEKLQVLNREIEAIMSPASYKKQPISSDTDSTSPEVFLEMNQDQGYFSFPQFHDNNNVSPGELHLTQPLVDEHLEKPLLPNSEVYSSLFYQPAIQQSTGLSPALAELAVDDESDGPNTLPMYSVDRSKLDKEDLPKHLKNKDKKTIKEQQALLAKQEEIIRKQNLLLQQQKMLYNQQFINFMDPLQNMLMIPPQPEGPFYPYYYPTNPQMPPQPSKRS